MTVLKIVFEQVMLQPVNRWMLSLKNGHHAWLMYSLVLKIIFLSHGHYNGCHVTPLINLRHGIEVCLMVFNDTFNNISVISWQSVLIYWWRKPGENYRPVTSHWQTLSQNTVNLALIELRTHISVDMHWLHN